MRQSAERKNLKQTDNGRKTAVVASALPTEIFSEMNGRWPSTCSVMHSSLPLPNWYSCWEVKCLVRAGMHSHEVPKIM
jgi:hypothetical protein